MKLIIKREDPLSKQSQVIGGSNVCEVIRGNGRAMKVIRSDCVDILVHEYEILKQVNHPNIIRLASSKPFHVLKDSNKLGLQLELGHIDLFHFLKQTQPARLTTPTIKTIFRNLADALVYLHESKQIAHNDIKLENIVLFFSKQKSNKASNQTDTHINPKLIDFGLASTARVPSSTIFGNWQNRSPNNLPPEIIEQLNSEAASAEMMENNVFFDLAKCDVFQFGLTLFNALFLSNPFFCENGSSSYDHFIACTPESYWESCQIQSLLNLLRVDTEEQEIQQIIDLMNRMFKYSPSDRPTMRDILNHPWFANEPKPQQQQQPSM